MTEEQPPDPAAERWAKARARSEAKNQAVRDSLEPLAPGERPLAVTIAAIVALLLSIGNFVIFLLADEPAGTDRGDLIAQTLLICGVLLIAAWGMWRIKYWAVLGFQTILALQVLILALSLLKASNPLAIFVFLVVIALSSVLFWYLIRAMARIQMPEAPETKQQKEARQKQAEAAEQQQAEQPPAEEPAEEQSEPEGAEESDG